MPSTEPLQHYQPRGMFSTWLGVVLLFSLFGLLAMVVIKASPRGSDYEKKRAEVRAKKFQDAQKENLTALTTYGWVDKNKGVARIPINQAMQIMLVELPDKKPTAAGPIAVAAPSAAPQTSPAANASPAASASSSPSASASTTPKPTSVSGPNSEAHNQPAAAANPPPAAPNTQPGPNSSPAASAPPSPAKPQVSASPSASPSAAGTPLPVRGKTP
ncbi:MAG TPA: hypothetical protein VH188_01465 [Chthoniobacterales bacterium]|jgi:hypothetical protein|nr:hypothetical protein [Chthoniobacterales bacterium]